ncbi:hypothetical protein M5K25_016504 [Dendrobium thyrsiflorum]|uniref:Pectinesterase inhibitor domain-containing protein n=1 Tax=Dendrobium thyrsiflorum TaxID=117978 RepID=A0ABD0URT2_DENTH
MKIYIIVNLIPPSLLFLFFLPLLSSAARLLPSPSSTTEFIKAKCNTTEFPHLCITSLSSYAPSIGDSTIQIAHAALNVSLISARATFATMTNLSTGGRLSAREAEAVSDCAEILADSVESLRNSLKLMARLSGPEFGDRIDDVQTWVSAALTDDTTCMDGFSGEAMDGEVKRMVRGRVVRLAQLTTNALALINELAPLP